MNKSPSKFAKKDWQKFIPYLAFFGVFIVGIGLYLKRLEYVWLGLIFLVIAIIAGFILHFLFGIKIIDMRRDFKNKKF
jgi:hypothetical protein